MEKQHFSVARVVTHTKENISKFERHDERKNTTYSNTNIVSKRTPMNIYFKRYNTTLNQKFDEMVKNGQISTRGLKANAALIKAEKADTLGNLIYSKTARNFNPMMATAAKLVIAEVDEIVEAGTLDPEKIVTPHSFVDMVVLNDRYEKIGGEFVERGRQETGYR